MKRIVLSLMLAAVSAVGVNAQQARLGSSMPATPVFEEPAGALLVAPTSANKTTADPNELVIDYSITERRPRGTGTAWNRSADNIRDGFYLTTGALDTLQGAPSFMVAYNGLGLLVDRFIARDSTIHSIPLNYLIKDVTFNLRHAMNRTDGQADSFIVRVYPRVIENGVDTLIDLDNYVAETIVRHVQGNASAVAAGPNSFYIGTGAYKIPVNKYMTLNESSDLGFYISLQFRGASVDTLLAIGKGYQRYATAPNTSSATPPAYLTDSVEISRIPNSMLEIGLYRSADSSYVAQYTLNRIANYRYGATKFAWAQFFEISTTIMMDAVNATPESFDGTMSVGDLYPNPASATSKVVLPFKSTAAQNVSVSVFNTVGQQVRSYSYSNLFAGSHQLDIDTEGMTPGIYLVRLQSPGMDVTKRLVVR